MSIKVEAVPNMPHIEKGDNIGEIIVQSAIKAEFEIADGDILCVASKVVSTAEGRDISLDDIEVSDLANQIHEQIPRKDPRVIQKIIDETGDPTGSRLDIDKNFVAGWLPNGMRLTSSGIDKIDPEHVMLLPKNPDTSARKIGETILDILGVKAGVIITDSDGRVEKAGSTQIAIGLYGVPALRKSESINPLTGENKISEETFCDLLAATAALIMSQRGTNKPVVKISGVDYEFDENSRIVDSLSRVPEDYVNE